MKFVNPSFQLITEKDPYKRIEIAGRNCYKSEDKITDDSAKQFFMSMVNRNHTAMLEHAAFAFQVYCKDLYESAMTEKFLNTTDCETTNGEDRRRIVSGNLRALNEAATMNPMMIPLLQAIIRKRAEWADLCYALSDDDKESCKGEEIRIPVSFISQHQIQTELSMIERLKHVYSTFLFREDRGCCYDDKTKVLTRNGWKYFKNVNPDDEYYTTDVYGTPCWLKAKEIVIKDFDGFLDHWKSTQVDLMVTPNHNMWLYDYDKRSELTKCWKFIKSEEATNGRYKFSKSARPMETPQREFVHISGKGVKRGFWTKQYDDLYLDANLFYELLGWWLTDGSCSYGKNGSGNRISITQSKSEGRGKVIQLLVLLGLDYTTYKNEIRINSPVLFHWLCRNFIKARDMRKTYYLSIPRDIINNLSLENMHSLLKGIIGGDGSDHTGEIGYQIYTASKFFAENIVELCLYTGGCANIRKVDPRERTFPQGHTSQCREQYVVSITNKTEHLFEQNRGDSERSASKTQVPYQGKIYCVELPKHHRLYVMRNGKAVWCGNTHEHVRHREMGFAQESTRYCNYSKDGFGNEVTFMLPTTFETWHPKFQGMYKALMNHIEWVYLAMTDQSDPDCLQAQQARAVLPQCLKADIVISGNGIDWRHMFNLRHHETTGKAHPDMKCVMSMAYPIYCQEVINIDSISRTERIR